MAGDIERGKQEFYVLIERDEDGTFVGEVPQLRGCYSQGKTLDELMLRNFSSRSTITRSRSAG